MCRSRWYADPREMSCVRKETYETQPNPSSGCKQSQDVDLELGARLRYASRMPLTQYPSCQANHDKQEEIQPTVLRLS